jgi:tagatose-1,6-bisphosphate aldolase non-catalytic subunit AgaZ/GatZ
MTGETAGDRFLIIEDIPQNTDAWGNFTAYANDIIEYDGANWQVIFNAQEPDQDLYQTNIYNGKRIQYYWNNVSWTKSFEGEYKAGEWRLEL